MYSVYIVDDEKIAINNLITSISWLENGFEVIGFHTNSQAALDEILMKKPDVVFCDLKMPGLDGIGLIRQLRNYPLELEIVMLSAYGEFVASREFFHLGGFDYILKPLESNSAALVLEALSRKLASKHHQTPSIHYVTTQSKGFDDIVAYVTENYNKKHSLNDLSNRFNIHPTYICDLFAKHYQSTLTIFITNLRMREASRLLRETDMPLKEIASFCGYPNYYHFGKVFKIHFGKSPSQYREESMGDVL